MKTKETNYQLYSNDVQLEGCSLLASFVAQNFASILSIAIIRR